MTSPKFKVRPLMISIISLRSLMAWLRPLRLLVISLKPQVTSLRPLIPP